MYKDNINFDSNRAEAGDDLIIRLRIRDKNSELDPIILYLVFKCRIRILFNQMLYSDPWTSH